MKEQRIGIIGFNKQDCEYLRNQLNAPNGKFYYFTMPDHPDGFMLDAVIETARAKENKHYQDIVISSSYCLQIPEHE
jgi:hypothetical protein